VIKMIKQEEYKRILQNSIQQVNNNKLTTMEQLYEKIIRNLRDVESSIKDKIHQ